MTVRFYKSLLTSFDKKKLVKGQTGIKECGSIKTNRSIEIIIYVSFKCSMEIAWTKRDQFNSKTQIVCLKIHR